MKKSAALPMVAALILVVGLISLAAVLYRSQQAAGAELEAQRQAAAVATEQANLAREEAGKTKLELPVLDTTPESSAPQRTEVDAKGLEVLVLDPAGAPVPGALLILFREQTLLAQETTDETGVGRFAAHEGSGEYVIAAPGWDLARGALELTSGQRTLSLIEGAVVAGTVLVDGYAPSPPMELSWNSNGNPTDRKLGGRAFPPAVSKALSAARGKRPAIVARTNADGSFAFRGLAADAAGLIQWSEPYFLQTVDPRALDPERRAVDVPAPKRDLLVRLIAGVELRLRVVDGAGAAVSDALVSLTHDHQKLGSNSHSSLADSEGRFVHAFVLKPPEKIVIRVSASEVAATQTYEFVPTLGLRGNWDLGDLATRATRSLSVRVQDTKGQPIKDAQVLPLPGPRTSANRRTDADGRIVILVGVDDTEIAAHAFGYTSARVAFATDAVDAIVTLAHACVVEFEVAGYKGDKAGLILELQGEAPLFAGDKLTPVSARSDSGGYSSRDDVQIEVRPNQSGGWRISGLAPNHTIQAKVREGSKELCSAEIEPLSEAEKRTVLLKVE